MPQIDELLVSFILWGNHVDPDEVTALLQVTPSDIYDRAESIPRNPVGNWRLESQCDAHEPLDRHLQSLLQQLLPVADKIQSLVATGATTEFRCALWVRTSQEGTTIQPSTLAGVAQLGASLGLTVYGGGGDDEEP